jgi:type II secretory pathway pseudopilin PulG
MRRHSSSNSMAGISLIEVLLAVTVLAICSLGVIAMVASSIATDTRNKFDSTTTMLAQSIVEQIAATAIGNGTATLVDCAGNAHAINTQAGGAALNGAGTAINFSQTNPPADYRMVYVVKSPCNTSGIEQATYDVRWNISQIGSGTTNSYMLTVSSQMLNRGNGNINFALPVTIRVMLGN